VEIILYDMNEMNDKEASMKSNRSIWAYWADQAILDGTWMPPNVEEEGDQDGKKLIIPGVRNNNQVFVPLRLEDLCSNGH